LVEKNTLPPKTILSFQFNKTSVAFHFLHPTKQTNKQKTAAFLQVMLVMYPERRENKTQ